MEGMERGCWRFWCLGSECVELSSALQRNRTERMSHFDVEECSCGL